jgi:glycosyltransferase involved in cell wall biosynthesis
LIYDCLYPYTVGGGERWYRAVAERLAAEGHAVTYLTLRQWGRGERPDLPGVRVVAVGPRLALYTEGRRRLAPPLVFGLGVLWHLLRHRRAYDVVQTASFPYFGLLAAGAIRPFAGYRLIVDWFEVWTLAYWRSYLGRIGGTIGWLVQRLCARVPQRAFCLSRLHARRLQAEGYRGEPVVLGGIWDGPLTRPSPDPPAPGPVVVFAGRHIPEKQVPAIVPAVALARQRLPGLRAIIFGDGPDRGAVERAVADHGLTEVVAVPGFVAAEEVETALRSALCLINPSRREGYGLVVIEAAANGVPSVVVAGPDNAATELIADGENGVIAPSASPSDLGAAIERIAAAGPALRESTAAWFVREAPRRTLTSSLDAVAAAYGGETSRGVEE